MKLENRTVLITGGTSGIGLELAKQLLGRGPKPRPSGPRCRSRPVQCAECLATGAACPAFKGIPYAAPPTGELRWRAP